MPGHMKVERPINGNSPGRPRIGRLANGGLCDACAVRSMAVGCCLAFSQPCPAQAFCVERQIVAADHRRAFDGTPDGEAWFEYQQSSHYPRGFLIMPEMA